LHQEPRALHRRPAADIGDAEGPEAVLGGQFHHEHACKRKEAAPHGEVGGGKAPGTAPLVAVDHPALEGEGPAQQRRGAVEVAPGEEFTNSRAADPLAVRLDVVDRRDAEAVSAAQRGQEYYVPGPALAEAEIGADDDVADDEPGDQYVADEILRRGRRQGPAEARAVDAIDARVKQQLAVVPGAGQSRRRGVGREVVARIGFEGKHGGRHAVGTRALDHSPDHLPVTEMHAVEVADGGHPGAALEAVRAAAKLEYAHETAAPGRQPIQSGRYWSQISLILHRSSGRSA